MIYDVNSPLFRSFLSQKGGPSDKRKTEEQKPKEQRPKASENKPNGCTLGFKSTLLPTILSGQAAMSH
uniref:Wound-induced basic protein n=1 Tax=Cucumis melo TaxID=3656 RepID=A0A9I9E5S5_CUCME